MSGRRSRYAELVVALFPDARLVRAWPLVGGVSTVTEGIELIHGDGRTERLVVRQLSTAAFKTSVRAGCVVEHDLVAVLHGLGLPVPRPRHVDTSCTVLSCPYVIYDFVEGSSMGPAPERMADEMANLLVRVHTVSPERLPVGLPARDSPLPELGTWVDASVRERAARKWRGGRAPTLLHGDYWPGNLLWRDEKIAGLVDWEDAAIGDPLSDLACARVELRCAAGEATVQRFTDRYLDQTGVRTDDLVVWDVYVSAAALASMDDWGLPGHELTRRKHATRAFLNQALARL